MPEHNASGIVFEGKAYHLLGRDALEGCETVCVEEADGGSEITKAAETGGIIFVTLAEAGSIDNVTMGEHAELFPEWAYPITYKTGQICRYNGLLYKCIQEHTSQMSWTPTDAVSQWVMIADPREEWPEWKQPIGSFDTYKAGDKVTHNEKHWVSGTDNNTWEPGVFGWNEVMEDAV